MGVPHGAGKAEAEPPGVQATAPFRGSGPSRLDGANKPSDILVPRKPDVQIPLLPFVPRQVAGQGARWRVNAPGSSPPPTCSVPRPSARVCAVIKILKIRPKFAKQRHTQGPWHSDQPASCPPASPWASQRLLLSSLEQHRKT